MYTVAETFVRSFVRSPLGARSPPKRERRTPRCGNNRAKQIFVLFLGIRGAIVLAIPSTGILSVPFFLPSWSGDPRWTRKRASEREREREKERERKTRRGTGAEQRRFGVIEMTRDFPTTREKCRWFLRFFRRAASATKVSSFLGSVD